jgi:hypothetical protein
MSDRATCDCGTRLAQCDGYWTVMGPHFEELDFCSLACMDSWLAYEMAQR